MRFFSFTKNFLSFSLYFAIDLFYLLLHIELLKEKAL